VVRRFSITIGAMLALPVALGALLLSLVVPVSERPQDDSPSSAPGVPGSPGDQDERAMEPPSTTPPEPGTSPGRRASERARRAPTGPTTHARAATRTPAEPVGSGAPSPGPAAAAPPGPPPTATPDPPAERTPPRQTPTPATVPAPPARPARQLRFLPSAEPVLCDASERTAGTLRGAMPDEAIRLTSPFLHRPIVLSVDAEGSATVTWSCDPGAARTVAVTARGADGRRSITFPVTGVSEQGAPSVAAIEAQSRVDDAADIVLDAVESAPDTAAGEGFAGVVVSPDHGELDLYWKGVPPEAVTDAIVRATTVTGIRIAARPAALTRHHLMARAHALVTDDRTLPPRAAPLADRIHRVAVLPEGTGLDVGVTRPAGFDADGVARWSRQARRTLEATLRVPVHLVVDDAPPTQFGRMADSSPWLGGARIVGGGHCSSGFGVRGVEAGSSTPFGLLTAAHCRGDSDGLFRNGDRTQVVGPDDGGDLPLDSRLVPVDEAGARIYTGGVGGTAEFTRPVRRSGRNVKGDEVCTSGAATGARCDLVVVNVDTFYRPAGSSSYSRVEAMSRRHRGRLARLGLDEAASESWVTIMPDAPLADPGTDVAAGRGDSGGPVFALTNDGGVEARGTIAGGSREVACGRHHLGACTANVFFVDIEPALDQHHAELVTTNARA
jgi:hypothetical protein